MAKQTKKRNNKTTKPSRTNTKKSEVGIIPEKIESVVPQNSEVILPEETKKYVRVPLHIAKIIAVVACLLIVSLTMTVLEYRRVVNTATSEQNEIINLREVNGSQVRQIEQLAKTMESLQQDMNRLNMLDAEIRNIVNDGSTTAVSRSGVTRIAFSGQSDSVVAVQPKLQKITQVIGELQVNIPEREQSLITLRDELLERNTRLTRTPSICPAQGQVTSRFGYRSSPWGGGSGDFHPGIDIASDYGTPIVAAAAGKVIFSGWDNGGYGQMVQIDHGNGIVSLYGHASSTIAKVGQTVQKGELIAYMGSTGASTGTHVHYEIRINGTPVDPAKFL